MKEKGKIEISNTPCKVGRAQMQNPTLIERFCSLLRSKRPKHYPSQHSLRVRSSIDLLTNYRRERSSADFLDAIAC